VFVRDPDGNVIELAEIVVVQLPESADS
jgi:hypothetical protein